ncbi:hypothetical protein AJ88_46285 [Mesorhizobium amorphae CCBAU 01583]|nr:hypothetical protein AJ88_46285 [Mesorhizobium amorphae CCBAU 01583]
MLKGQTPLVCLTAYTTPIAKLVDRHCDIVLVGDAADVRDRRFPAAEHVYAAASRAGDVA